MKKHLLLFSTLAFASSLSMAQGVTHVFQSGQPAIAAQVNQNFTDVTDLIDATVLDIATNGTSITTNSTNIAANAASITALQTSVAAIPDNSTQVGSNTSAIAANDTDIATNVGSITSNAASISTNSGNISANITAIADNTGDIVTNETTISGLSSRVTTLEATSGISNTTTLAVDCSSETIGSVLASAPAAGSLVLNITGTCTETLVIDRDNISLVGTGSGASIAYSSEITTNPYRSSITDTVTLIGADNIIIDNITVSNALTNGFSTGLRLLNNASVLLTNSTIENTVIGIWASHSSTVQMSNNTVQNNSSYSLLITDAAVAEIREGNLLTGNNSVAGVGIYRNGSVRVQEGTNTITNTSLTANAVEAYHGSQFRSERGTLTINGGVEAGTHSQAELRDTVVTGDLVAGLQGIIRLRPSGSDVTINGDVFVSALGLLNIAPRTADIATINGNISCFGPNAVTVIITATITGDNDLAGNCNN